MEEMSLNKWMVFCKEFEIVDKLYQLRLMEKERALPENKSSLLEQNSVSIKELKEVEHGLINIFKSVNDRKSKIDFQGFTAALVQLFNHFKPICRGENAIAQFVTDVLCCASEKDSLVRLSCLKFTSSTPQISYEKIAFPEVKSVLVKSRLNAKNKENRRSQHQSRSKCKSQFKLNPIVSDAKKILNNQNSAKLGYKAQLNRYKLKGDPRQLVRKEDLFREYETNKD
jgi:hypothetical protein